MVFNCKWNRVAFCCCTNGWCQLCLYLLLEGVVYSSSGEKIRVISSCGCFYMYAHQLCVQLLCAIYAYGQIIACNTHAIMCCAHVEKHV